MLSSVLIGLIAALHIYILALEMFFWEAPIARRAFGLTAGFAKQTRAMAANQGLYNGFLAAGLLFGLWLGGSGDMFKIFFLSCVGIAGIFGGLTAAPKIFFIQTVPAALALLALLMGR